MTLGDDHRGCGPALPCGISTRSRDLVRRVGDVAQPALEQTLNCGVGMVALTAPDDADKAVALLAGHGIDAWVCGEVTEPDGAAGGSVTLRGRHPGW